MIFQLTYVSVAVRQNFKAEQLAELLRKSRTNNLRDGVTGLLLFNCGNFMQALEGEQAAVLSTYARIRADERHTGVVMLDAVKLERPTFAGWDMAFREWDTVDQDQAAKVDHFFNNELKLEGEAANSAAVLLLKGFARAMSGAA